MFVNKNNFNLWFKKVNITNTQNKSLCYDFSSGWPPAGEPIKCTTHQGECDIFYYFLILGPEMASVIRTFFCFRTWRSWWNDAFDWCFIYNGPYWPSILQGFPWGLRFLKWGEKQDKENHNKTFSSLYLIAL